MVKYAMTFGLQYIFNISPGEYGIPRPWYFIFQINYWGGVPLEAGMPIPEAPTQQNEGKGFQNPTFLLSC